MKTIRLPQQKFRHKSQVFFSAYFFDTKSTNMHKNPIMHN